MSETLQAYDSAKAAYRQSWSEWRNVIRLYWLPLVVSFLLLTLQLVFRSYFKGVSLHALHVVNEFFVSSANVAILRFYVLGMDSANGRNFYLRIGRREIVYAIWTIFLNLLVSIVTDSLTARHGISFSQFVSFAEKSDSSLSSSDIFIGMLVEYGVPLAGAIFMAILILTWPYLAVVDKPKLRDFNGLNKAVKGNIESILVTLFYIFLPYGAIYFIYGSFYEAKKTTVPFLHYLRIYSFYCVERLCGIVQLSFMADAYKKLWLSRPG